MLVRFLPSAALGACKPVHRCACCAHDARFSAWEGARRPLPMPSGRGRLLLFISASCAPPMGLNSPLTPGAAHTHAPHTCRPGCLPCASPLQPPSGPTLWSLMGHAIVLFAPGQEFMPSHRRLSAHFGALRLGRGWRRERAAGAAGALRGGCGLAWPRGRSPTVTPRLGAAAGTRLWRRCAVVARALREDRAGNDQTSPLGCASPIGTVRRRPIEQKNEYRAILHQKLSQKSIFPVIQ